MNKFAIIKNGIIKDVSEFSRGPAEIAGPNAIPMHAGFSVGKNVAFKSVIFKHLQNLEIEITTKCNLKCVDCDRRCRQAPSNEEMSLSQIEYFVKETKIAKYAWKRINILGGEPYLHSNLSRVIEILSGLGARLDLISNGYGEAEKIGDIIPPYINLKNTKKKSPNQSSFVHVDLTMLEKDKVDTVASCYHVDICGLGLTRYGFYPCGPGASIDRVLGFDIGIKKISDISVDAIHAQQRILCPYCGWSESRFKFPSPKRGDVSAFWKKAYDLYNKNPKALNLYGVASET
jgi:hypothetical protein